MIEYFDKIFKLGKEKPLYFRSIATVMFIYAFQEVWFYSQYSFSFTQFQPDLQLIFISLVYSVLLIILAIPLNFLFQFYNIFAEIIIRKLNVNFQFLAFLIYLLSPIPFLYFLIFSFGVKVGYYEINLLLVLIYWIFSPYHFDAPWDVFLLHKTKDIKIEYVKHKWVNNILNCNANFFSSKVGLTTRIVSFFVILTIVFNFYFRIPTPKIQINIWSPINLHISDSKKAYTLKDDNSEVYLCDAVRIIGKDLYCKDGKSSFKVDMNENIIKLRDN